jgi:hypothetical protein
LQICSWNQEPRRAVEAQDGRKAARPDRSKGRKGRADKLLDLEVRSYLGPLMIGESAPSVPDWMVLPGVRRAKERESDNENVYVGMSAEF